MERTDARMLYIRESVASDRAPLSVDDMSDWLLRALTGGDVRAYAEKVRARAEEREELAQEEK